MNKSSLSVLILLVSGLFLRCSDKKLIYSSDKLEIEQITEHSFVHRSFLQTESFGKVSCNGLIYVNGRNAVVFDTPPDNSGAIELISWIATTFDAQINAVIVSHSHEDCIGGLSAFHMAHIPSYAYQKTVDLAHLNNKTLPQNAFNDSLILIIGGKNVESRFLGEGHTKDNIVGYIPSEKVLFGGCLIKEMNGTKGYVAEANLQEWSETVRKVKSRYSEAEYVIPGHGDHSDTRLFDYTISLFADEEIKDHVPSL